MNMQTRMFLAIITICYLGLINSANATSTSKKIEVTAEINDGIFVSKPDGHSWYNNETLEPTDIKQTNFSKTFPIRVWSTSHDFNVSLAQPLALINQQDSNKMAATVSFNTPSGVMDIKSSPSKISHLTTEKLTSYDDIYEVTIKASAPTTVGGSKTSLNGVYRGDLVLMFEPAQST